MELILRDTRLLLEATVPEINCISTLMVNFLYNARVEKLRMDEYHICRYLFTKAKRVDNR